MAKATKKTAPKEARKGSEVYTIKQANTVKGKLNKSDSRVVRERAVLTNAYADKINNSYKTTGKYAELDEAATDLYIKGKTKEEASEE